MRAGDAEHPRVRQQGQKHHEQAGGQPEAHQEDAHQGIQGQRELVFGLISNGAVTGLPGKAEL